MSMSKFEMVLCNVLRDTTLASNARLIYAELLLRADKKGQTIVTQAEIAARLGLSHQTVMTMLHALEKRGLTKTSMRKPQGRGRVAFLRILLPLQKSR